MDMKQYPAKRRNRKHQTKISGDKTMNVQNTNDEVQDLINKSNKEKQALIEYAGLVAAFETEAKRVLGKAAPETADEALAMCNDPKCKEAMDALNKAYFTFVEGFGYSPEFACTGMVNISNVQAISALHMEGNFKPKMEDDMSNEAKEVVEKVAEATNDAVEAATEAVEKAADAVTDTVDSAKVVAIEAIEEAEDAVETVTAKVEAVKAEAGEDVSIDLTIEEAPKKRELSEEEKAQIKADAEAKAKAEVARLTEEARRSQNPFTAAYDFITKPFSKA